ncbi:MAG: hypothetical protein HYV14_15705 [Elusimicrobia bacterium]|nr:hypothetical protein [Elusimicrobiota bacterium]
MKITALAVALLTAASALPLRAQVNAAPQPAPVEKPKPSCPCDSSNFKPLTDKARAVEAYWDARRSYRSARTIAGTAALFAMFSRNGGLMNEAQNTLSDASSRLFSARAKAEQLGALKVTGDDLDGAIEIKLRKGVDYTL